MDGIHIPDQVAERERVPDDLDSSVLGPYQFPSPARRRLAGLIYLLAGGLAVLAALADLATGFWVVALGLLLVAFYHFQTAWPLNVQQEQALATAAGLVTFPVGHASAALTFRGWRSRPVWNVIVYAAQDPPDFRALVQLSAVTGRLTAEPYLEQINPPAWVPDDLPGPATEGEDQPDWHLFDPTDDPPP